MNIIEVKHLSKKYNIAHQRGGYVALRDVLANIARRPFEFVKHKIQDAIGISINEEFWALKDVNFKVEPGEVVGIIGRNGAGKSTLLKILTGITPPTDGEVIMRGKVASLLEVGTGFHPELTGRENIFLNGAILGMPKREIARKFDEIVAFAEVEQFLDTPVKYYSSGMYVRLAFSVAAHVEPDILLVDEVLAVGDAEFQKKCLGKMEEATKQKGRTILFVSHNMVAIEQLCSKCILIEKGALRKVSDNVKEVADMYLATQLPGGENYSWSNTASEYENDYFVPLFLSTVETDGRPARGSRRADSDVILRIEVDVQETDPLLNIAYALYDENHSVLYWSAMADDKKDQWPKLTKGRNIIETSIPAHLLNEGNYFIELLGWLHMHKWLINPGNAPTISLNIRGGLSESPHWIEKRPGILAPLIPWRKIN